MVDRRTAQAFGIENVHLINIILYDDLFVEHFQ